MNSSLTRRQFVFGGLSAGGLLTLPRWAAAAGKGVLVAPSLQTAVGGKGTLFSVVHLETGFTEEFAVPLDLGHAWIYEPGSARFGVVTESGGRRFCLLDLKERRVLKTGQTALASLVLGGHAEYSHDGKSIFVSQFSNDGAGSIGVFDARTFRETGRIPSYGPFPHELFVRNGGKEILVANLGYDSIVPNAITFCRVEVSTGKLLAKNFVKRAQTAATADGHEFPDRLLSEAGYFLRIADLMATTPRRWGVVLHPHAEAISVWNLQGGPRLRKFLRFGPLQPVAWALTPDSRRLAVSLSDNSLLFLHTDQWTMDPGYSVAKIIRSSTHLFAGGIP